MGWARLDDGWHDNRKIVAVGCEAAGLWVMCLTWAHKERRYKPETCGVVPDAVISRFAGSPARAKKLTALLLEVGLFDEHTERGWPIHDFHDYLPQRDPEKLAENGRKGGLATQERRRQAKQDSSKLLDEGQAKPKQRRKQNQASRASAPAFPNPYPYPVVPTTETSSPTSAQSAEIVPLDFDDAEANAGRLIAEWIRARGTGNRPPDRVVGHASRELKTLLGRDGIPFDVVRAGFAAWADRNIHPSAIASVVDETRNGGRRNAPKPSTTNERVGQGADVMQRMAALDAADGLRGTG